MASTSMNSNQVQKRISLTFGLIIIFFIICFLGWFLDHTKLTNKTKIIETQTYQLKSKLIQKKILQDFPGVIFWGDSLTQGKGGNGITFPNIIKTLIHDHISPKIPVINCGVGGETTNTIIGRAGGVPFVAADPFVIPPDISKVKITLLSTKGLPVAPLRQGDCGVNPVKIDGVLGKIEIEQKTYESDEFTYYFSRMKPGDAVKINGGTKIITSGYSLYRKYLPVIFIGQNGGFRSDNELILQQTSILYSRTQNREKYIILGLTSGNSYDRFDLETAMYKQYGNKFINLRKYLSTNGLADAGLTPTEKDLAAMEAGFVPPSLLSDAVHLNSTGYKLIGNLVYKRMVELGYFTSVLDIIQQSAELK